MSITRRRFKMGLRRSHAAHPREDVPIAGGCFHCFGLRAANCSFVSTFSQTLCQSVLPPDTSVDIGEPPRID